MKEATKPYPFKPTESLLAEGKVLAKSYGISFNMLLSLLLEDAITEWSIPTMEPKPRPDEAEIATEGEKSLT
jgi:hypothetical protein